MSNANLFGLQHLDRAGTVLEYHRKLAERRWRRLILQLEHPGSLTHQVYRDRYQVLPFAFTVGKPFRVDEGQLATLEKVLEQRIRSRSPRFNRHASSIPERAHMGKTRENKKPATCGEDLRRVPNSTLERGSKAGG